MPQNILPCTSPKEISVREHDYSVRLMKIAGFPKRTSKPTKNADVQFEFIKPGKYEVTELFIEPIITNVIRVLTVDGTVTQLSTNIPLEEICHTEDMLELQLLDDITDQDDVTKIFYLNEACKICLKDLSDSLDKISFFDDFGQISSEVSNVSATLESMNVEITNDDQPKQMCIECYNMLCKMTLFKQICKRSKRALDNIREFTAQQQLNMKVENDLNIMYGVEPNIVEIKEEQEEDMLESTVCHQYFEEDEMQNPIRTDGDDANEYELDDSFICIRCGIDLLNQNSLLRHRRFEFCVDKHNPECRFCKEILPTLENLDHHLENSHNCFPCTKCAKTFNTLDQLNKHQRQHETFICDFCSEHFYSKRSIEQHLMSHVIGSYICLFCDQEFPTTKRLGIHKRSVHPDELYKCPHCPKEFKLKDRYRVHLMKHNPDKRHKCTYCPSQFVHRHHLENHIRTHTKETPFLCNFCGKAFRGEVALRGHLSIHDSKTYPYRYQHPKKKVKNCTICDYSSVHGNLKKHMIKAHGQSFGPRGSQNIEFSCHICDKVFRQSTSLMNHMKIHDEIRDFHCNYCKASFRKPHYLRLHVDGVHFNKKPNKCDQCDAAYLMSNDLRRHKLQKHSKERPFQCYYCHKTFAMASTLKVHIKGTHRITPNDL